MNRLRFSNQDNFFELAFEEGDATQGYGHADFRVLMSAQSNGFAGNSHCWVKCDTLRNFLHSLTELEKSRQGEAVLNSISPGELSLRVFSVSPLGHLAIEGGISHVFFGERIRLPHNLTIGFEFDPSQLASAVNAPWVSPLAP